MCGIAGEIRFKNQPSDEGRLRGMSDALAHRGPDGQGIWIKGNVGLTHRRLSIVDLSDAGAQPMVSEDGALAVVFNGEIYNYQALRDALVNDGAKFRSTSDTEVLLHLYKRHGQAMLEKLHGMFAFALWDVHENRLFFARDRIGKKPFYYRLDERGFSFASELKALTRERKPEIDWSAVRVFLGLQYVPSPQTGFVGISSLSPAHFGVLQGEQLTLSRYAEIPRVPSFDGSETDAAKEVRRLLEESVRLRLIADVPVGTFLSGGVDSSAIAAIMARRSSEPIKTFTMGFPSFGFDERVQAASFAKHIGSEHHEFEAKPETVASLVDTLSATYDAPFADASSLPTWLLARETKTHVKAVMTGDGGDELFAGYRRYRYFAQAEWLKRHGLSWLAINGAWVAWMVKRDPRWMRFAQTLEGIRRSYARGYADLFTGSYFQRDDLLSLLQPDFRKMTDASDSGAFVEAHFQESLGVAGALDFDLHSYLPDDLNVKMDRATMAHGLEARAPFLDQDLVAFVARLPLSFSLKPGRQKAILHDALKDLVPEEVFSRPKRGFQVPLGEWLRRDLRPMFVERCLADGSGLFRVCQRKTVERYLKENDRGMNQGNRLWMLLVLATWIKRYE